MFNTTEIWYRYDDVQYAAMLNEWDEPEGVGRLAVELRQYEVKKFTPKGVRLSNGRFVLRDATKRFAAPSKEEAMVSFIARKTKQARILSNQLQQVHRALEMAKRGLV